MQNRLIAAHRSSSAYRSSVAVVMLLAAFAAGCQRTETAQPPEPAPAPAPAPAPVQPKADPAPANPPSAAGASAPAATPTEPQPDKPKPIPHTSLAKDAKPMNTFKTPTSVVVEEHRAGTGFPTLPKAVVTIHFELRVQSDWSLVQSTYQEGSPETRRMDVLVLGLADGLIGMRKGALRRIIVPPTRGFGSEGAVDKDGKVVIPPDATLVFDVELIDVQQTLTEMKPPEMPKGARAPGAEPEPGK